MIKAIDLEKSFGDVRVLNRVSLEINHGEVVSIVGESGAGKTTLLQILGTLEKADRGKLLIDGTDIQELSAKSVSQFRNQKIGFVFQFHHLLPEFNALENVCIPAMIQGESMAKLEQRAKELLSKLKLDHRIYHKPSQLSGGEQQRVAVARALMNEPAVIFADEPSGNLDSGNADELHNLFFELRDNFGQTFVIVTHNKQLAGMADRQLTMVDGQIC